VKGATLVCSNGNLVTLAADHLGSVGRTVSASNGVVQVADERGRLYSFYDNARPDWEWHTNVDTTRHSLPNDWASMHAYAVECRWEDLFVEITEEIGAGLTEAVWVVDGNGVLWPARNLDPQALRL
jgi:hypothetical protein